MISFLVHHVSLVVNNIDDALRFYSILGFSDKYIYRDADGKVEIHHLKNTNFIIELFKYKIGSGITEVTNNETKIGIEHFSMQVENIDNAFEELSRQNVKILTPITAGRTGINYFFISDPDGNKIEIVEDKRVLA